MPSPFLVVFGLSAIWIVYLLILTWNYLDFKGEVRTLANTMAEYIGDIKAKAEALTNQVSQVDNVTAENVSAIGDLATRVRAVELLFEDNKIEEKMRRIDG